MEARACKIRGSITRGPAMKLLQRFTTPARRVAGLLAILCTFLYVAIAAVIACGQLGYVISKIAYGELDYYACSAVAEIFFFWITELGHALEEDTSLFECFLLLSPWIAIVAWPFALGKITPVFGRFVRWVKTGK